MKFEQALEKLRAGKRIWRSMDAQKGSLAGSTNKVLGSFYLTIYDVLAEDWTDEPYPDCVVE